MAWGTLLGSGLGAVAGGLLGGPMGAGVGMSAGGALGGAIEGAFDDPEAVTPTYVDPSLYDTSGYDSISADARAAAAAAAKRQGPAADWSLDNQSRDLRMDVRGRQMGMADELDAYLRGTRPPWPSCRRAGRSWRRPTSCNSRPPTPAAGPGRRWPPTGRP